MKNTIYLYNLQLILWEGCIEIEVSKGSKFGMGNETKACVAFTLSKVLEYVIAKTLGSSSYIFFCNVITSINIILIRYKGTN